MRRDFGAHEATNSSTQRQHGRCWLLLACLAVAGCVSASKPLRHAVTSEERALALLQREVPAWSRDNGCFSCHNNGDAARALYAASAMGFSISKRALADTTAWVAQPARWDRNKGDPAFSNKKLADIQFTASLLAAIEGGFVKDTAPLRSAAFRVAAGQDPDGCWRIGPADTLGSPATHGTLLATHFALKTLKAVNSDEVKESVRKAEAWLRQAPVKNTLDTAALLLALKNATDEAAVQRRGECLGLIRKAQASDGGWGPYPDVPSEPFDTAVVLLALSESKSEPGLAEMIQRGRRFLLTAQSADGSWPETTRPPGGESYAQRISTTGWATQALLATASKQ
jgi:hypothetical protein